MSLATMWIQAQSLWEMSHMQELVCDLPLRGLTACQAFTLCQTRMLPSLCFLKGKNHSVLFFCSFQGKNNSNHNQNRGQTYPTGRSKFYRKALSFDAHGSTERCCQCSGALRCPIGSLLCSSYIPALQQGAASLATLVSCQYLSAKIPP